MYWHTFARKLNNIKIAIQFNLNHVVHSCLCIAGIIITWLIMAGSIDIMSAIGTDPSMKAMLLGLVY